MEELVVESPAKINLGLNVIRKRNDGYHDLETLFFPLLLSDIITFKRSEMLSIKSNSKLLKTENDNLVMKAIQLLVKESKAKLNFEIYLEKRIPIGGGLGGGSSNAAVTLKTVNRIMNLGLSFEKLTELSLHLGSDVPYFLNPIPSFAKSRGENLLPVNFEIPYPILLVNPAISIDTRWAFSRIKPKSPAKRLIELIKNGLPEFEILRENIKNDFEDTVFSEYPELKKIKEDLYAAGAQFALMSGTGSTIFGIFSNLQKAYWAEDFFKQKYFTFLNDPFKKGSIT